MNIEMIILSCAQCHIPFCITEDMRDRLKKCHNTFYCPAGHGNVFNAKSEEEKLKDQLGYKQNEIDLLKQDKERLEKQIKMKTTKTKKRTSHATRRSSS